MATTAPATAIPRQSPAPTVEETVSAPCGVDLPADHDDGGHSQAWEDHAKGCRECSAWEREWDDRD